MQEQPLTSLSSLDACTEAKFSVGNMDSPESKASPQERTANGHASKRKRHSPAWEEAEQGIRASESLDLDTSEDEVCLQDGDYQRCSDTGASGRSRPAVPITLELLSQGGYYDMPMSRVARLLGRTEGSFQRVCRGLGILRWPYRVRKSLQAIMEKTEQYLDDDVQEDGMSKAEVLRVLQGHMDDIKGISGSGMDKATKQYRQYIFKVNHKLSRKAAKLGDASVADNHKVRGMLRAASKIQKSKHSSDNADPALVDGSRVAPVLQNEQPQISQHKATLTGRQAALTPLRQSPPDPAAPPEIRKVLTNASQASTCPSIPGDLSSRGGVTHPSKPPLRPTRPTPRHFRDLPDSLAFEPLGREKAGPANIMARMATCAAVQNRLGSGTAAGIRQLCLREDQELLQMCLELDTKLEATQRALAAQQPSQAPIYHTLVNPDLMFINHLAGQHLAPSGGPILYPSQPLMPAALPASFWSLQ